MGRLVLHAPLCGPWALGRIDGGLGTTRPTLKGDSRKVDTMWADAPKPIGARMGMLDETQTYRPHGQATYEDHQPRQDPAAEDECREFERGNDWSSSEISPTSQHPPSGN